jgi:hypothetical protein
VSGRRVALPFRRRLAVIPGASQAKPWTVFRKVRRARLAVQDFIAFAMPRDDGDAPRDNGAFYVPPSRFRMRFDASALVHMTD